MNKKTNKKRPTATQINQKKKKDERLDKDLKETFPASDPITNY